MRNIGQALQARAKELGLTDSEVARRLGLAQARYSKYVNGIREPDFATFMRICKELSITPNEALGLDSHSAPDRSVVRQQLDSIVDGLDAGRLDLVLALVKTVAQFPSPMTGPAKRRRPQEAEASGRPASRRRLKPVSSGP